MQLTGAIQRVSAQEALRESKEELQTIYDGMVDGVLIVDGESKEFVLANPAICEMLGYTEEELLGMALKDIHPEEQLNGVLDLFSVKEEGRVNFGKDIPCLGKDGSVFFADVGAKVISYGGRMCGICFFRDSTERKRTEEALQQMAAGMAHEIRNPLSAIATGVDLLERKGGVDPTTLFRGIREESKRLEDILTNFLGFARPYRPEVMVGDINFVLEEIVSFLEQDERFRGVDFEVELDRAIGKFSFDRDRIRQVLWNLALNGLQSMAEGGVLRVRSAGCGDHVELEVIDGGGGIMKRHLGHIFEPFYTTKRGGTGLGLAIAEKIVKGHGGRIEVESEVGSGTKFTVSLPVEGGAKDRDG